MHARLQGEWLAEFEHGVVLSLGAGAMWLAVENGEYSAGVFGKAQQGYIEFGHEVSANARISYASVRRFFELTVQTILSGHTTIELATFIRVNAMEPGSSNAVYGPLDALAFCEIGLTTPRQHLTMVSSRPALILRGYGPRKLEVVRLMMRQWQADAGEAMTGIGNLAQPLQLIVVDSMDIGILLDLAEHFIAAGADIQVGPAGRFASVECN